MNDDKHNKINQHACSNDRDEDKALLMHGKDGTLTSIEGRLSATTTDWKGSLTILLKAYSNKDDCYSRTTTENFDRKFMLLNEQCDQSGIPDNNKKRAFSMSLTKNAQKFYFDSLKVVQPDLQEMAEAIKGRF